MSFEQIGFNYSSFTPNAEKIIVDLSLLFVFINERSESMKYGVLMHKPMFKHLNNQSLFNIGDNIQSHAVRNIYKNMGINEKDIVEVNKYELSRYNGDYLVVPISNFTMINSDYGVLPISPKIIPVFISFNLLTEKFSPEIEINLRNNQPIGCRDEFTMENMRKHNILAYLSGCITATLPKRSKEPQNKKAFFVDVPKGILPFIPDNIKENSEFTSHLVPINKVPIDDIEAKRLDDVAVARFERYKNEATLIVTSRLHCAAPCMAMGIPVILVANNCGDAFGWIDKFLHFYSPDEFDKIDWYPKAIEYEKEKEDLINMFAGEISRVYNVNKPVYDISSFYENRTRSNYNNMYTDVLMKLKEEIGPKLKCAVWGATSNASILLRSISKVFDEYEIVSIIDEYVGGEFQGIQIEKSICIDKHGSEVVYFIVAEAAREYAIEIFKKKNKRYVCITGNL